MSWFTLFLVCYRPLADYFTTRGLCAGEPAAKAKLWQDPPRRKRAGAASSPVRSLPSSGARQEAHHRQMEPISIPGSMASPLSSQRRRHVAGAMTNTHALRGTSPMSGPDMGEVPRSACVFVMAPATWRRLCEERGEAMDPGMDMGSICR